MGVVKKEYPPFNDYMLKRYRKEKVDESTNYLDTVFKQAVKLLNGEITYLGYTILAPEHRINEQNDPSFKRGFNIQQNELKLVRFEFKFQDEIIFVPMYLPYIKDDAIVIDDTKYYLQLAIIEKVIHRVSDGIIIKVIRSPLFFWRTEQYSYETTKGDVKVNSIITTKIHLNKRKNKKKDIKTALLLYLLSHYGFIHTLEKFEIDPNDITFLEKEELEVTDDWDYIKIKDDIFLRANKSLFKDNTKSRVVASLVYCLRFYKTLTIPLIYDESNVLWKIIIGKCIYESDTKDAMAHNHAEKHFSSLASYLDPITKNELAKQGIFCNDIYDLILTVFKNINQWIFDYRSNNLYAKKIGVLELIMSEMVKAVFAKFYIKNNDQPLNIKMVKSILKIPCKKITTLYNCGAIRNTAAIYNDNALLTIVDKKIRQPINQHKPGTNAKSFKKKSSDLTKSPDHQFDPSFITVESILDIPSSNPGDGGAINPYAEIDTDGNILCPDYAESDLSELYQYLPRR